MTAPNTSQIAIALAMWPDALDNWPINLRRQIAAIAVDFTAMAMKTRIILAMNQQAVQFSVASTHPGIAARLAEDGLIAPASSGPAYRLTNLGERLRTYLEARSNAGSIPMIDAAAEMEL